jgi:hypothetical protein
MRANQLRIGNLVRTYGQYIEVEKIDKVFIHGIDKANNLNSHVPIKHLKGIQLTEDWLLRFGFGMMNKSYFSIPSRTRTNNSPYSLVYTKDLNGDWYILIDESVKFYLEHVHQLQNLYFALTGEELTLKQ